MKELKKSPAFERALRVALSDPVKKAELVEATCWHDSMPSKVLAGDAGITLDKLDKILNALGLVVVESSFIDYLAFSNRIGTDCSCARAGYGACGNQR